MLLSYEIESLRRPRKKTRRQQTISFVILRSDLNYRCARTAHQTTRKESVVAVTGKITFSLIQFLSCPAPSVDVGRFVRKKKNRIKAPSRSVTNSRRACTHATCACYCCCCCEAAPAVPGGPGSSFSWWLPGEVAPPTNKTGPGSIPLPIPQWPTTRLLFWPATRREEELRLFFLFLLRPFFLISFLQTSYLFLCAFPGHQNLLIWFTVFLPVSGHFPLFCCAAGPFHRPINLPTLFNRPPFSLCFVSFFSFPKPSAIMPRNCIGPNFAPRKYRPGTRFCLSETATRRFVTTLQ